MILLMLAVFSLHAWQPGKLRRYCDDDVMDGTDILLLQVQDGSGVYPSSFIPKGLAAGS
jgi:hypothetical protein